MSKATRNKQIAGSGRSNVFVFILFAVVILVLYGQSISFDFTIDDDLFVKNNPTVAQGISGIAHTFSHGSMEHFKGSNFQIYRPAVISALCIEQSLFGMKPQGYHFVNVLLYFILAVVMYQLLRLLMSKWHSDYSLLIVLLFLAHPVHTEVVASVKSQDELFAALFNLSALLYFIRYLRSTDEQKHVVKAAIFYLFAVFSKEGSVAFAAIFPLLLLMEKRNEWSKNINSLLPLIAVAVFFVGVRYVVLQDVPTGKETSLVENVLYGAKDVASSTATKAGILWYYIKLQFWPHPLTWDYSFNQIPVVQWGDWMPLMSVMSFGLILFAMVYFKKKEPLISFGFAFFLIMIAPVSNLFFLNGTTFAERFLFLPSFGFILACVVLIAQWIKAIVAQAPPRKLMIMSTIVLLVFAGMTMNRAADWRGNYSIFLSGAEASPNSSRAQAGLASQYMNMAETSQNMMQRTQYADSAVMYFRKSVEIYPENASSLYKLGLIAGLRNDTATARDYYKRTIEVRPDYVMALNNLAALYSFMNKADSALIYLKQTLAVDSMNDMANTNITIVYSQLKDHDNSILSGEKAIAKGIANQKIYNTLSLSYQAKGDSVKASYYRQMR
jgi:protein O-mannosyl-transferase